MTFIIFKVCSDRINKIKNYLRDELEWQPSEEDVSKLARHKTFFMGFFYQYALYAMVAGLAIQPLLKFVNPAYLSFAGIWVATNVVCAYRLLVVSAVNRYIKRSRLFFIMFFMMLISVLLVLYLVISAYYTSLNHDEYCYRLQILVERGTDSEKNSTIFNNMQCRIQPLS